MSGSLYPAVSCVRCGVEEDDHDDNAQACGQFAQPRCRCSNPQVGPGIYPSCMACGGEI